MVEKLADRYSARVQDVLSLVAKQAEENKELRKTLKSLSERAMESETHELLSRAVPCGETKLIRAVFDHRPFEELKSLAMRIADSEQAVVLFGNRGDKGQLAFACSKGLPHKMNELVSDACAVLQGRGGGSATLAFGGGPLADKVEEAVEEASQRVLKGK